MGTLSFGMVDLMRRAHDSLHLQRAGHHSGTNAALFSAMATEAFMNDITFMLQKTPWLEGNPELIAAAQLMPELESSKVSIEAKYGLLYYVLARKAIPKSDQTWDNFKFLIKIRNHIAHFRPSEMDSERNYGEMHKKIVNELRRKKLLMRNINLLPQDWTMLLDESTPFAEWSIKSAQDIILLIHEQIPASCVKRCIDSLVSPNSTLMGGNRLSMDGQLIRGRDILKEGRAKH